MNNLNPYETEKIKLIQDISKILGVSTFRYRTTWDKANKEHFFPNYNQEIIALQCIYNAVEKGYGKGSLKATNFYVHFNL